MITVGILTISDTRTKADDASGKVLAELLKQEGYSLDYYEIVPDEKPRIIGQLKRMADKLKLNLILTCGGTGLGKRDVTPEATDEILEKRAPGIILLMVAEGLKHTKLAALSRACAGVRRGSLIINLPGSPKGASESFQAVKGIVPHALQMMRGQSHKNSNIKNQNSK